MGDSSTSEQYVFPISKNPKVQKIAPKSAEKIITETEDRSTAKAAEEAGLITSRKFVKPTDEERAHNPIKPSQGSDPIRTEAQPSKK